MAMSKEDKLAADARFARDALRWLPEVSRFALSLSRSEADADDLVQETFLRAYRAWGDYEPGTECRAWLFTICRNAFRHARRRERREVLCDDPELEALAAAAVHASAQQSGHDAVFSSVGIGDAVVRAVDALPEEFREVVILVDVEDQSYQTAAAVLDVPLGTVRSRLFRARRLLQEALIAHARDAGLVSTADAPDADDGGDATLR